MLRVPGGNVVHRVLLRGLDWWASWITYLGFLLRAQALLGVTVVVPLWVGAMIGGHRIGWFSTGWWKEMSRCKGTICREGVNGGMLGWRSRGRCL